MPRKLSIMLAVVTVVLIGFIREFLFININEQLFALWYDEPSRARAWLPLLHDMEYYPLYYTKWGLTIVFAALFFLVTHAVLKLIFRQSFFKPLAVIYSLLLFFSALAMAIGYVGSMMDDAYLLARFLMGIAQSPLILMVMIPGIWLRKRQLDLR